MMIGCFCHDRKSRGLMELVRQLVKRYPDISFEAYDESSFAERRKAHKAKSPFGARATPFFGLINQNGKLIKGFYSEAQECTAANIRDYLAKMYDGCTNKDDH